MKKSKTKEEVSAELVANLQLPTVFLLSGEMGSGKTTLTKAIGDQLAFADQVQSPTYNLKLDYLGSYLNKNIHISHMDLYRLADNADIRDMVFEENLSQKLWIIEWPEKTAFDWYTVSDTVINIRINVLANFEREFLIQYEKADH